MESAKLSIIIPTCNRPESLVRSVKSALTQDYQKIEIVIVDDSREDESESIRNIFGFTDKVSVYRNTGPHSAANARNFGVEKATGKYITFLDDDDVYLVGRLKNVMNFIENSSYIFVSSGRFAEINDFEKIQNIKKQRYGSVTFADNLYLNDIDIGFTMLRSIFLELKGFNAELKSLEDWDLLLRALRLADGYKLKRMDYAVNVDPSRVRVSNNDGKSYLQLAGMYKEEYGDRWYAYMMAHGLSMSRNLSLKLLLKYTIRSMSARPIIDYLRQYKSFVTAVFNLSSHN